MNTAILLSGGIGSRLNSDIPKQYIYIESKMLITYALESLVKAEDIHSIVIVAHECWHDQILNDAKFNKISVEKILGFAAPGVNRQSSILNGMEKILQLSLLHWRNEKEDQAKSRYIDACDTVMIHDAARPLLTQRLIQNCYKALLGPDGVMPVLPMKDTIYLSCDGKKVTKLLDRKKLFAGQAPELFLFNKYYNANKALKDKIQFINGSTEPAVLAGMDIVMISGDEKNFKITTDEDMKRFRNMKEQVEEDTL